MFIGVDIRKKLAIVWLVLFLMIWVVFTALVKVGTMREQLDRIEQAVSDKDWKRAEFDTDRFKNTYKARKYIIQMNNSSEIYITFEHTVEQLDLAVKNKQESAIEYVGLLKGALNYAVKPFSEP